jgi:hypothetical protein
VSQNREYHHRLSPLGNPGRNTEPMGRFPAAQTRPQNLEPSFRFLSLDTLADRNGTRCALETLHLDLFPNRLGERWPKLDDSPKTCVT